MTSTLPPLPAAPVVAANSRPTRSLVFVPRTAITRYRYVVFSVEPVVRIRHGADGRRRLHDANLRERPAGRALRALDVVAVVAAFGSGT